jgi:hypothetical protein
MFHVFGKYVSFDIPYFTEWQLTNPNRVSLKIFVEAHRHAAMTSNEKRSSNDACQNRAAYIST